MSVYCELSDVVQQIRYKTQIFYETFKRDSIAEQIYNFSNDVLSDVDPDIQFSKSLDKDYSLIYKPVTTTTTNTPSASTPPSITLSPPPQQQQQQQAQQQQAQKLNTTTTTTTSTNANNITSPAISTNTSSVTSVTSSGTTITTSTTSSDISTTNTSTNTSTVTSATNSSTISSLTSTDASTSSAFSTQQQAVQQIQQPQAATNNNTTTTTNTATVNQQPTQPSTSPKKCKIVTFTGTSVKLNKALPTKSDKTTTNPNDKQQQPDSSKSQQAAAQAQQSSTTTSTGDQSPTQPIFVFIKEKVNKPPTNANGSTSSLSLLTRLVKPQSDDSMDYGDIVPPPGMGMSLTIHTGSSNVGQLKVRVIEKATVIQTIVAALRVHHSNSGTGLIQDPKAYILRIADSNGKIDQDFPPLDPTQMVNKFKEELLVLVPNPKFDLKKSSSLSISGGIPQSTNVNSNNSNNSNSGGGNSNNLKGSTGIQPQQQVQHQHSQQPVQQQHSQQNLQVNGSNNQQQAQQGQQSDQNIGVGGGGSGGYHRTHHRNVSSGPDAPLVVKITLPDSSITKVVFQKTMLLKDLLESTCKKRKLLVCDHYFTLENGTICNGTLPMEKLGGADLILVSKRPIEPITALSPTDTDSNSSVDLQQDIFWYDALAWQYKTYEVTKTKKYGPKQDRIIGVDKERITNMSPKETETKRPARLIKDISKVALLEKPKYFTIEYNDGKSYIYEAKTTSLANEIVGKICYILGK